MSRNQALGSRKRALQPPVEFLRVRKLALQLLDNVFVARGSLFKMYQLPSQEAFLPAERIGFCQEFVDTEPEIVLGTNASWRSIAGFLCQAPDQVVKALLVPTNVVLRYTGRMRPRVRTRDLCMSKAGHSRYPQSSPDPPKLPTKDSTQPTLVNLKM